jgi:IPT/TIG domain
MREPDAGRGGSLDRRDTTCIIRIMEGDASPGRGQAGGRACAMALIALAAACALCAAMICWAAAPVLASAGEQARAVCGAPPAGSAACTAIRLRAAPGGVLEGEALEAEAAEAEAAEGEAAEGEAAEAAAGEGEAPAAAPAGENQTPPKGFLTPEALHAAYSLPSETAASAKQTIAVVDAFDDPTAEADLGVYDEQFDLPPCTSANGCFRKVNQEGKAGPLPPLQGEWAGEISIDVQIAHAICENCRVLLVEAESEELTALGAAVNAAAKLGATEISNSYASPEEPAIAGFFFELGESSYNHPGVVIAASTGDCAYLNAACSSEPPGADFPADLPDVIAVGGTELTQQGAGWASAVWDETGSGCSQIFAAPAWQLVLAGFAATGCGGERSVADVSADADPKTGVDIYDSTPEGIGAPTGWTVFGGTSVATPIVAAEYALAGGSHGIASPGATLYSHAGEPGAFYDVVAGANGSCGAATSCQAAAGYDGPSGLGSPVGLNAFAAPEAPKIKGFTPASAITGSVVTIEGSGLGATSEVRFGTLPAKFTVLSAARVEATVPNGASKAAITLSAPGGSATSKAKFTPTLSIVSFTPQAAAAGKSVTIKGVGFNASSSVGFDGTRAQVKSESAKKLKVIVPAGAGAGPIEVTNVTGAVGTVYSAAGFKP